MWVKIALTPPTEKISDLERARRFFVRARQVRTGLAQTVSVVSDQKVFLCRRDLDYKIMTKSLLRVLLISFINSYIRLQSQV